MSNLRIFFIFATLVAIVSTNQGVEASRWQDAVMVVQQKIDGLINSGINEITGIVEKAKKKVDRMGESLKVITEEFGQRVYNRIEKLLKKVDSKLNQLTANVTEGIDVSQCKQLAKGLQYSGLAALSNMSSCIIDKLERGGGYMESISKISSDVLFNLTLIRDEAHRCSENVDGPKTAAQAIVCSNVAGAKATWVTAKSLPRVTAHIAKLTFHMTTLPVSLPYCAISHGYRALTQECSGIVTKVRKCIDQKIFQRKNNGTVEQSNTENQVELEEQVEQVEQVEQEEQEELLDDDLESDVNYHTAVEYVTSSEVEFREEADKAKYP